LTPSIQISTVRGLRVATEHVPGARSVCSGVWVGVGARDEPAELAGVSHFLEHLLFKGTAHRSAQDLARAVDRVGGDMNAFTTKEYTAYYTRLPAGAADLGLELLGDVISSPALRDLDVESERQVIAEELAMDDDTPDDKAHSLLADALFPKHPLGRETAGDRTSVASITADQVRSFFGRWYRPANIVVAVAGDVDHADVVAAIERWPLEPTDAGAPVRTPPGDAIVGFAGLKRSTEQVHVAIGYRAMARRDPDREALDVLNHVLGGGMSSRLFDEIRERRGLAYAVFSGPSFYADAGALSIYAGTSKENLDEVLDCIDTEIDRLVNDGVTDTELDVARGYLSGSYLLGLEDAASRMSRLGGQLTVLGELADVDEQLERFRSVTADDVLRVARRVLTPSRALAVVGPVSTKALRARVA
jgi:predicted Zn-dependent peptidase